MTPESIKQFCPKAENITVFPDGSVGMKVGSYSQAVNISLNKSHDDAKRQIKNLYLDLLAMNRREQQQVQEAKRQAKGFKWQS